MTPDTLPAPTPGPGSAPASRAPTVLDQASLDRLRELDPTGAARLMHRIVAAYDSSLERLLPDLAAARAGTSIDLSVVRHVSHTLKSSSASLGALNLAEQCAEIETKARNGTVEGLDALLDNMLIEVEQVRLALQALLS